MRIFISDIDYYYYYFFLSARASRRVERTPSLTPARALPPVRHVYVATGNNGVGRSEES